MAQYGKQEYWNSRYEADPEPFEWFQHWAGFRDIVVPSIKPQDQVLVVGCGNSKMSEDLYDEGVRNLVSIDFSPVVIKAMEEKCKEKSGMQFKLMDIREMEFPDGVFDVVIDKATIDSALCAEGSLPLVAKCLGEISRILSSNGIFVCISHGPPNTRLQVLERPEYGWSVSVQTVPKPMIKAVKDHIVPEGQGDDRVYHYVYICVKK